MYLCDKCGGKIYDISKPCPTCGLFLGQNNEVVAVNKKAPNTLFIVLFVFFVLVVGVGFVKKNFSSEIVRCDGVNYSLKYNTSLWSEYSYEDGYFVLQSISDKMTFLQFPVEAANLNIDLKSEDNIDYLYQLYLYVLKNSKDVSYSNISSDISIFNNSDYYYLTADYVSYNSISTKGKLYVIFTSDGKVLNVVLNLGNYNLLDIEDNVYDILSSIEM